MPAGPYPTKAQFLALEATVEGIDSRLTTVEQTGGGGSTTGYVSLSEQPRTGFVSPNGVTLTARRVLLSVGTAGRPVALTGVSLALAAGETLSTADLSGVTIFDLNDVPLDSMSGEDVPVTLGPGGATLDVTGYGYPLVIPRGGYLDVQFNRDVNVQATSETSSAARNWSNAQARNAGGGQIGRPCLSAVLPDWRGIGPVSAQGMRVTPSPTALPLGGFEIVDPEDTGVAPTLRLRRWDGTIWTATLTAE